MQNIKTAQTKAAGTKTAADKNFEYKKNNQAGFTLIELLAVIVIMGLMATLVVANFNGTRPQRNLTSGINLLVTDFHGIQSDALSSRDIDATHHASGYSIYLNSSTPNSYQIIAYDDSAPIPNRTVLSQRNFPQGVIFEGADITNSANQAFKSGTIEIEFTTPYARILQTYAGSTPAVDESDDETGLTFGYHGSSIYQMIYIDGITGNLRTQ